MGLLHLGGLRNPLFSQSRNRALFETKMGDVTVDGSFEIQLLNQLRLVVYSHDFSNGFMSGGDRRISSINSMTDP